MRRSTLTGPQGQTAFAIPRGAIPAIAVFGATIAACAFLASLGGWMPAMILAVVAGLGLVFLLRDSFFLAFSGLVLCAAAGIGATSIETPLFGATVRGIRVDQAAAYPTASIFHFSDGRVLAGYGWDVPVYGSSKGNSHELYTLRIAPIVGEGWTPGRPVTAWAVTTGPNSSLPRADWSRPSRAGVRVVSSSSGDIREAIASAGSVYGLASVENAVLLHWVDDPEAAVSAQYWKLLTIFCVCLGIWGVLVVLTQWHARRRGGAGGFPQ